ncbi:DUF6152 family protein [Alteraurantiacibacter aquimixticola]|uniref:Copper chaperone PCu(A)C n=1 Tax=Alteraurantiacibacter aquimixticola TaxID=2489173 RepID=A0A4T3F5X8_9SPHN|nr:DUF6152 family protein [Alteraurantiacibacter aquimixticola]TIX51899.1 hypothetical protein E5222_05525 [Alteraurantiacibacter aquimixticola]
MSRKAALAVLASLGVVALAAPAASHHSFAMFDQRQMMTLEGTVKEFQWTNPHAFIELEVDNGRTKQSWSIELNSPNNLTRQGWRRTSLRPGERITLRMAPLRNGEHGGLFLDLTKADGTVLDSGLPKNGQPVNVPQF